MLKSLLGFVARTRNDVSALILRLGLAAVIFPHGARKMLGWWGGQGFEATIKSFEENLVIPPALTFLVIVTEFFGPIALALGLLGRIAALAIGVLMVVAMTHHVEHGFFMNWFGTQEGEGYEYHILVLTISLALFIRGSGMLSLDQVLGRRDAPFSARHDM